MGAVATAFAAGVDVVLLAQGHPAEALGALLLVLLFLVVTVYDVSKFAAKAGSVELSAETRPQAAHQATAALQAVVSATAIEGQTEIRSVMPSVETRGGPPYPDRETAAAARGRAMSGEGQLALRRSDVEALIRAAAHWGWTQAKADLFSSEPVPHVEWDQAGRPNILFGTASGPGAVLLHAESKLSAP